MAKTIGYDIKMVVEDCCSCNMQFGLPEYYYDQKKADGETFSCPNGHKQHYGKSDISQANEKIRTLKHELRMSQNQNDYNKKRATSAKKSLSATRGVVTRLKNKAASQ